MEGSWWRSRRRDDPSSLYACCLGRGPSEWNDEELLHSTEEEYLVPVHQQAHDDDGKNHRQSKVLPHDADLHVSCGCCLPKPMWSLSMFIIRLNLLSSCTHHALFQPAALVLERRQFPSSLSLSSVALLRKTSLERKIDGEKGCDFEQNEEN